jgi:hypothetical protein
MFSPASLHLWNWGQLGCRVYPGLPRDAGRARARIHMSERIFARLVPVTYLATGAGFLVKALS